METKSDRAGTEWLIAAACAGLAALAFWYARSPYQAWGDDFAGYVLQAMAMDRGTVQAEYDLNARLLALGDDRVGPDAYPWGFPALLWMAARFVGWSLARLQAVGLISLLVLAASCYFLARHYLSRSASVAVALLVSLQVPVLVSASAIESDLPSLAVSAAALACMQALARPHGEIPKPRLLLMSVASLLAIGAFTMRTNGAFVSAAIVVVLVWSSWGASSAARRALAGEMLLWAVITCVLLGTYLSTLPEGNFVNASYVSDKPDSLLAQFRYVLGSAAEFVPFSILRRLGVPSVVLPAIVTFAGVFAGIGAWRHRQRAAGLVAYGLLNGALLVVFPGNGVARYSFPLLLPLCVLGAAGVGEVVNALQRRWRVFKSLAWMRAREIGAPLTVGSVMLAATFVAFRAPPASATSGPETPVSDSLFTWVRANVPANVPVIFFKPRALRLFTERHGIAVVHARNLGRASYLIFDKRADDGRWQKIWQVNQADIEADANGRFVRRYENGQFIVYVDRSATREARP